MGWWLGITTTRLLAPYPGAEKERGEFAVQRQLEDMGIECLAPRKVAFRRKGKKRYAEAEESPYLPGYVFADIPDHLYITAMQVRGLCRTLMIIHPEEMRRHVAPFFAKASEEYKEAQRIIARNDRAAMCQYEPGQALEILSGAFSERAVRFLRMVENSGTFTVEFEADMFGRVVKGQCDPLDVRANA